MLKMNIAKIARETAETAVTMLKADSCPLGKVSVIVGNAFGGILFHEACGHSLEASQLSTGKSEFYGLRGEKIANEKVTAIDDGTICNKFGSTNVDDEGTPTRKNILIEGRVRQLVATQK